ncbi:MAG: glycosyltransferase family 4 protein [Acidobacteriota bacterium]|nr:glycosyltransferase family 4 protein [Acidobacteriota bacterium]
MTRPASRRSSVLMVTGAYFPELSGGGLQCRTMVHALREWLDFSVLTTCTDSVLPVDQAVEGTPVTRIYVDVSRPMTKITAAWRTVRFFLSRRGTFDAVHLHGFSQKSVLVILLARLLGKKVIITIHTAGTDEPEGVRRLGRLAYWCYSQADRFLAISEAMARNYRAAGLAESRLRVVPNGVDTDRFRPAEAGERDDCCRELGLDPSLKWVAFVGFFSRDKNPDLLFDAWLALPPAVRESTGLIFAGATESKYHEVDPTLAQRIRTDASRLGLLERVRFLGELPGVERLYRAADVLAMPSTREAFGMVLVEAMASGLQVVATHIPGVTDAIVEDGVTGLLVPPRDRSALAVALARVLADRSWSAAVGTRARLAVNERYGLAVSAARWRGLYADVLGSPPARD